MFGKEEQAGQGGASTTNKLNGFIGKGMKVEGKLKFDGTVKVDGNFKGDVFSKGTLVVGDGALVEAQVNVSTVVITGEVRGTIEASSRVEMKAPGKVFGDIKTPTLIIGEGVVFEGNCIMTKKDAAASAAEAPAHPQAQKQHKG